MKKIYVSRDTFLAALSVEEQDLEIEGLGTVRIRPLTLTQRAEMQRKFMDKENRIDTLRMQTATLLMGLVAPQLTEADLAVIEQGRPGLVDKVSMRILDASGMADDFEKKAGSGS